MVDLRDAEVARLELLNEALDPLFAEIPPEIELFDRGLSRGETPRLWIDAVAHVAMGRDKRIYRLLQDTRVGRRVLAESHEIPEIVKAVTDYVARRLVERERALEEDPDFIGRVGRREVARERRRRRRRATSARWCSAFSWASSTLVLIALLLAGQLLRQHFRRLSSRTTPSAPRCRAIISQRQAPGSPSM